MLKILFPLLSLTLMGCSSSPLTINDFAAEDFKPTAKLSYQIVGKRVAQPTAVHNTLENTDYLAQPKKDVVLKGTAGELWVTPLKKVQQTYLSVKNTPLTEKDFPVDQFIPLKTKAGKKVFALFVPKEKIVKIMTAWGDELTANRPEVEHGEGDYLVCSMDENGKANLKDVWVVNGKIFPKTYEMANF